jgi:hypothetical protein
MADTFRALCANLTAALNDWQCETGDDRYAALINRARAALAQPEPQGPTDEELCKFFRANDDLMRHCEAGTDWDEPLMTEHEFPAVARAVLTRYARPAIEPVAVSERLPGPEDCDAEGRCWWFSPPACGPHTIRPCWTFDSETLEGDTYWLAHWALPVPVVEGADG